MVKNDLAPKPGVLVEDPSPGIALEDVLLLVRPWRKLVEPLLGDIHLALRRARVDLLEPVGRRVDEARVDQGLQEGLARQAHHLVLLPVEVDGRESHDAVRDLLRGGRGRGGGGSGD